MLWLLDGKIVGQGGIPIDCSHCPCQICSNLELQGTYEITLTVTGYTSDIGQYTYPTDEQFFINGQSWGTITQSSATLYGVLPANGFIMSNREKVIPLQNGSTPFGSWQQWNTYHYIDGGSDTYWEYIEGDGMQTIQEIPGTVGNGWLIIHCNNENDGKPYLQVYFANINNCTYQDNWTDGPEQWNDSLYVLPNNFSVNNWYFDVNQVNLIKGGAAQGLWSGGPGFGKYILQSATLTGNKTETRNLSQYIERNSVTVQFVYHPPANTEDPPQNEQQD